MQRYKVTCLKCKRHDVISIVDSPKPTVVDYEGKMKTPFTAFRWRPDLSWGFMCKCGQDNRLAKQEEKDIDKLVDGDAVGIAKVVASLKEPEPKFQMVAV